MKLIENITSYLIETEVEQLLSCGKDIDIQWVNENYNAMHCESSIFGLLDRCIKEEEVYTLVLQQIINNYCDDELDFYYIADEVRKEYVSKKKNPPLIQDNTGYYRTIKAVGND